MAPELPDPNAWLCHYTTAQAAFGHILPTERFRLNPYGTMRDPLENRALSLRITRWSDESAEVDAVVPPELVQTLERSVARVRNSMRLLSLTTAADHYAASDAYFACPWARARLWEHYGDVHAGACLVFDRDSTIAYFKTELDALNVYYYAGPVEYTPRGFTGCRAASELDQDIVAPRFADKELLAQGIVADDLAWIGARWLTAHYRDVFFLKTLDWNSEHEFRLVVGDPRAMADSTDAPTYLSYGDMLQFVIVGERFPPWQLDGARAVCDAAGVALFQMMWDQDEPRPVALPPRSRRRRPRREPPF